MDEKQLSLLDNHEQADNGPVVCLGMTFKNDEERREYFRNELRKKLPELKKIEGFPIGDDEDIIALSDPPYYTACPNPWINDFIEEWEREKKEKYGRDENEEYHREPFAADVSEGKTDAMYMAHGYHTKVPFKAIIRYILHYTKPGDIILDAFSGTGMTGVSAALSGYEKTLEDMNFQLGSNGEILLDGSIFSKIGQRKAILSDISPVASFISYNYTNIPDAEEYKKTALRILSEVEEECGWMFETIHSIDGQKQVDKNGNCIIGRINYTVYSDVFMCPNCSNEIVFTEVALDFESGKVRSEFNCPYCSAKLNKRLLERVIEHRYDPILNKVVGFSKQVPYLINYNVGKQNFTKKVDQYDIDLINKVENTLIPYVVPLVNLPAGVNTDQPRKSHGIEYVHQFYTRRALYVLSKLFDVLNRIEGGLKYYLIYTFEQAILGMAKIARYVPTHFSQVNQYLSGTLYIGSQVVDPSLRYVIKNKIDRLAKILAEYRTAFNKTNLITTQAAQDLNQIGDETIDYIFTDPPFGANLMYSELNVLWESWLKIRTNNQKEAIVNKAQNKSLLDYKELIYDCFKQYYRVLKPNRWITVEFSNSQASVWNTIQEAIQKAGFIIANVSVLDKKQGSFKAITSTTAVKQDLVISAYKPRYETVTKMKEQQNTEESAWTFVRQHLEQLPVFIGHKGEAQIIAERTPRILFDRMVAYHVQNGLPVPISSAEFQAGVAQRFPMRDGMAFLESQVAEYDKKRTLVKEFVQTSLFVTDETSAIEWLRQQLLKKPQTRQDLHPNFMKEIQHIAKHEKLPELDDLLHQNFLKYEGDGPVPDQIASYLRKNYKDLRGLENDAAQLKEKALNRWYVPDPNKQADLEKLREKALLREFEGYLEELEKSKKKLKQFRTEAIRAGFKKAWSEKDYEKIVKVGERLPESVIQEDDKLLMYYDNAQIRLGL
ncbi:DNA methyltransferase [Anoxybacteroides rupiense]|uniref:DNA methyltransferase n=1 Tax=Anoxybacteroides rupiense TaxID=311460 RepID=UPI001606D10E|nr:DNA methyltransferase [Anoxybacillus rupiensis]MBB3906534.1 DNA modification methylase/DNA-directed RNA polymerase subunit RPC12/RpoP [Anoxybacillus rupiensis]